jgi:hypothetical protein
LKHRGTEGAEGDGRWEMGRGGTGDGGRVAGDGKGRFLTSDL